MKRSKSSILAVIMVIVFIVSSFPGTALGEDASAYVTRGQAADMILMAADDYNPGVKKEDIIKGYGDGTLKEDLPATRIEAVVMLSRGFGQFSQPKGNSLRTGVFDAGYTDVPAWAKADTERIQRAGVLTGTEDGRLGAYENITAEELNHIIQRIWALEGSNLKDDFYAAVNKAWLESSEIPAGEAKNGTLEMLAHKNDERLSGILEQLLQEDQARGTKEQKIADFYKSALDLKNRNEQGIEPIRKYLEAYENAQNLEQLIQADIHTEAQTGNTQLIHFGIYTDPKNSNSNILYHVALFPTLEKDIYVSEPKKNAYIQYMAKLLILTGEDEKAARARAEKMFELEKELSAAELEPQEQYDVNKTYNPYTLEELESLYPAFSIGQTLEDMGYKAPDKILIQDKKLAEKSAQYLTEENLDLLKIYAKLQFLFTFSSTLSEDFNKAAEAYDAEVYGVEGVKTDMQQAAQATQDAFPDYLGEIYVERYFSAEAKKDVEDMIKEFIGIYKNRITNLDWMGEETKQKAIKKLDTLTLKVGYPAVWPKILDYVEIYTYTDGGSYFENKCAIHKALAADNKKRQGMPVDKTLWGMNVYKVNAYYNFFNNEIVFPAGILQAPFYDLNVSKEQNFGAIGVVIAHEISHAFDNNGAKFDQNGNAADWWTEEDYRRFAEKCGEVAIFYDGIESVPGIKSNGLLTLSENIADLGGISCSLQAASQLENPDYKAFFEAHAGIWKFTASREFIDSLSKSDVHSFRKIRVNRSIVNFDAFYEAFGISERDGMYVAPEKRVGIW